MKRLLGVFSLAVMVTSVTSPAGASVVFFDDFSSEALQLNATLDNWTLDRANVDVVGTGLFGELCAGGPSPSHCVDLDGSGGTAGRISHFEPTLGSGVYELSFWLQANDRGFGLDTVRVSFGTFSQDISLTSLGNDADSWIFYSFIVNHAGPPGLTLTFDHLTGGDFRGILLDDVAIAAVPEPASVLLLGAGLLGIGVSRHLRRRRASRQGRG